MKDYLNVISIIILISILVCSIVNLSLQNKTLDYLKYSDYVLNDGLMQTDSLGEFQNGTN